MATDAELENEWLRSWNALFDFFGVDPNTREAYRRLAEELASMCDKPRPSTFISPWLIEVPHSEFEPMRLIKSLSELAKR